LALGSSLIWDGADDSGHRLSPGVYICHVRTENAVILEKIVIVE
jgi:hypothetical protein